MAKSTAERFWAKVLRGGRPGDCWEWTASRTVAGYGQFKGHPSGLAHRYAYELLVGPIPEGLTLDHLCRVRHCCNPAHLEPVTPRTNYLRGVSPAAENARRTACPQDHPYDAANTYVVPSTGRRQCRVCRDARNAARQYRPRPPASPRPCRFCGTVYTPKVDVAKAAYCSRGCKERARPRRTGPRG